MPGTVRSQDCPSEACLAAGKLQARPEVLHGESTMAQNRLRQKKMGLKRLPKKKVSRTVEGVASASAGCSKLILSPPLVSQLCLGSISCRKGMSDMPTSF